jgi:hypothetical protein
MEQDNSIPCLIEKTENSICGDIVDPHSSWDRPPNAVEWWNEDETNRSIAGGISFGTTDAAEWNLNRFNERLGEASIAPFLVWKELEKPTVSCSSKKPSVTRLQDCYLLDLDCDGILNESDNNHRGILPNPIVNEDQSDSLSWPYDDSLFFTGRSPCLWNGRKRRIAMTPSTTLSTDTTNDPTVTLDPSTTFDVATTTDRTNEPTVTLETSTTFHDDFSHQPKFHVWSQDPLEATSSIHTRYVPMQPEATTPPPMRVPKRKKGWNAAHKPNITETNSSNQNSSESPTLFLPTRKASIDPSSSRQKNSAPLPLKWLHYKSNNDGSDNDDSSTEQNSMPKRDNQECNTNRTTGTHFRQIIQQNEPITEADFMTKPTRSMFHRLMYEQTMGLSMAAVAEHRKKG